MLTPETTPTDQYICQLRYQARWISRPWRPGGDGDVVWTVMYSTRLHSSPIECFSTLHRRAFWLVFRYLKPCNHLQPRPPLC